MKQAAWVGKLCYRYTVSSSARRALNLSLMYISAAQIANAKQAQQYHQPLTTYTCRARMYAGRQVVGHADVHAAGGAALELVDHVHALSSGRLGRTTRPRRIIGRGHHPTCKEATSGGSGGCGQDRRVGLQSGTLLLLGYRLRRSGH